MSDIVSIELLLDPETEALVRADWDALAAAGLSSLGAHRSPSNRPHVTLLARTTLHVAPLRPAIALLPIDLALAEPIVFRHGDRGVLARRVVPTTELRGLHAAVHAAFGPGPDAPHTAPGHWTPHVTLARRLRLTALDDALGLLGAECTGAGTGLRRWDSASALVTPLE